MNVLILGGTYFIGRHLALHLVERGHDVTLLNRGTLAATLPTLHVDRNDPVGMRKALAGRSFDLVIDTSCYDATQALIAEGALSGRYRHWLFLSSAAVYSDHAPRPLTESSPAQGSAAFGAYGKRKLDAERVLTEICGSRLTILRSAYVYGPGNNLARETFIWARLLSGEVIYLPGDGSARVSFIHIQDLALAVDALVERSDPIAGTFNLAHPQAVSLREWVMSLARQARVTVELHPVPTERVGIDAREFFPFRNLELVLDATRLSDATCFQPLYDLERGLRETFVSYEREDLMQRLRSSSVEIELGAVLGVRHA